MKCKSCNGTGKINIIDFAKQGWKDTKKVCPICHGTGTIEQTNEKWFDGLSTEEKARWFCDHIRCSDCRFNEECLDEQMGQDLWIKWLKQPHGEVAK